MFIENQWWQLAAMLVGTLAVMAIASAFSIAKQHNYAVGPWRTLALALVSAGAAMLAILGFVSAAVGTNWGVLVIAICWVLVLYNITLAEHGTALLREDDEAVAD